MITVHRLKGGDEALARTLFGVMAEAFEDTWEALPVEYLREILAREDFWILAALEGIVSLAGSPHISSR